MVSQCVLDAPKICPRPAVLVHQPHKHACTIPACAALTNSRGYKCRSLVHATARRSKDLKVLLGLLDELAVARLLAHGRRHHSPQNVLLWLRRRHVLDDVLLTHRPAEKRASAPETTATARRPHLTNYATWITDLSSTWPRGTGAIVGRPADGYTYPRLQRLQHAAAGMPCSERKSASWKRAKQDAPALARADSG